MNIVDVPNLTFGVIQATVGVHGARSLPKHQTMITMHGLPTSSTQLQPTQPAPGLSRQTQAARSVYVTQAMNDFLELRLRGATGTVKVRNVGVGPAMAPGSW